jgi:hypothetical protein
MVEQAAVNRKVVCSTHTRGAKFKSLSGQIADGNFVQWRAMIQSGGRSKRVCGVSG